MYKGVNGNALLAQRAGSLPHAAIASSCAQGLRVVVPRSYFGATWTTACLTCACCARFVTHTYQRSAGKPERNNDVKLSRGGIREVEFTK